MPNTRDSSARIQEFSVRQPGDTSSAMSAIAWPASSLMNLTSIASHSFTATYALWSELMENQRRFTVRLLNAMGSTKAPSGSPQLSDPSLVGSIVGNSYQAVGESFSSAMTDDARRRGLPSKSLPTRSSQSNGTTR